MTQGYYAGISGLQAHQYGLDVVADNLSNNGTIGYKSSTTEFSDLFSKVLNTTDANSPTSDDIGHGVKLQTTSFQFQQGELIQSDRFTDLAIEGNGWFGISSNDKSYFTRDGHFTFDTYQKINGDVNSQSARLVTPDGKFVTGTMLSNFSYDPTFDYGDLATNGVSGAYTISDPATEVNLSGPNDQSLLEFPTRLAYPVEPTTSVQFMGNLGIENLPRQMNGDAISINNQVNRVNLSFVQSASQPAVGSAWDIVATVTSKDGSVVYDTQNGQAFFDGSGALSSFTIPPLDNNGSPLNVDLGTGSAGVVSINNLPISGGSQSNGLEGGILTNYTINRDGVIIADFSNGRQSAIGRVAVYHFQNDQGLNRSSGSYFLESANSGKPIFWTDENGDVITGATIRAGSLEASNVRVDIGMTDMIIMQRAYQANAKTITTIDEMIQKALQMHR